MRPFGQEQPVVRRPRAVLGHLEHRDVIRAIHAATPVNLPPIFRFQPLRVERRAFVRLERAELNGRYASRLTLIIRGIRAPPLMPSAATCAGPRTPCPARAAPIPPERTR